MPKEQVESPREIAKYLVNDFQTVKGDKIKYPMIGGLEVTWPHHHLVEDADSQTELSEMAIESHEAMKTLFNPGNVPENWKGFLESVKEAREEAGLNHPLNLVSVAQFIVALHNWQNPDLGVEPLSVLEDGIDATDRKRVALMINFVLGHPELGKKLFDQATVYAPDMSHQNYLNRKRLWPLVDKLEDQLSPHYPVHVDLCCGWGGWTVWWSTWNNLHSVGIDRQFGIQYLRHRREDAYPKTAFLVGDARETIIPDPRDGEGGADFVTLEYVVPYVSEKALGEILTEVNRILLPETGILAVGPQSVDPTSNNDGRWRLFKKEANGLGGCDLVRRSLRELLDK